eukprot:TRINITY_DN102875_c0_g1_i1.p1 TRINITY_DN102875_c0_g1~~TRINITY_DN102875_c0_g1_i1.p1  ORF type:complete len:240 (+),score=23.68 TRINITY_DN102875_c0_g1_i1:25-720(+)
MLGRKPPKKEAKIVLLGGKSVGKTSIIQQVSTGVINESIPAQTVTQTSFTVGPHTVVLKLYDIPGEDLMGVKAKSYCRTAQGVVFIYDMSSESSYKQLSQVFGMIKSTCPNVPCVLVGNKADGKRKVKKADAQQMAKLQGMEFAEISAHNPKQTMAVFSALVNRIFPDLPEQEEIKAEIGGINDPQYDDTVQLNESSSSAAQQQPDSAMMATTAAVVGYATRLLGCCTGRR